MARIYIRAIFTSMYILADQVGEIGTFLGLVRHSSGNGIGIFDLSGGLRVRGLRAEVFSGVADDVVGSRAAVDEWSSVLSGTCSPTQGDRLAFYLSQHRTGPGVVASEDEESGESEWDAGNDGQDAARDAGSEEEPAACHSGPSAANRRVPVHAH